MSDAPADHSFRDYAGLPYFAFPRESGSSSVRIRPAHLAVIGGVFDLVVVWFLTLSSALAYHIVFLSFIGRAELYVLTSFGLGIAFSTVAGLRGHYSVRHLEAAESSAVSAFKLFNVIFALFICALFMTKATEAYSRASLALQYGVTCGGLIAMRVVLARIVMAAVRRGRVEARRIALIGTGAGIETFITNCGEANRGNVVLSSIELADWVTEPLGRDRLLELDHVASQITAKLRDATVDDIVLVLPWGSATAVEILAKRLTALPATVQLMPRSNLSWFRAPALTRMGNNVGLSLSRPPLTAFDQAMKRVMDVVLASLILIAVMPLMLMIAVAIWAETGGAVLFLQQRHGFNQKPFKILKFRTMTTADDGDRVIQAISGDRRITTVGRILRRSSLDELPQLINVLKGDMSLVGPRPHALAHTREYEEKIAFYAHRHNVKPGLTGWAQVNGYRGETNAAWKMEKRVEHDLYYIDNWSLMLDLKILIMTVFSENTFKNAA
jgi:Undecaprenyl-phosphate glucose phosphotransferase